MRPPCGGRPYCVRDEPTPPPYRACVRSHCGSVFGSNRDVVRFADSIAPEREETQMPTNDIFYRLSRFNFRSRSAAHPCLSQIVHKRLYGCRLLNLRPQRRQTRRATFLKRNNFECAAPRSGSGVMASLQHLQGDQGDAQQPRAPGERAAERFSIREFLPRCIRKKCSRLCWTECLDSYQASERSHRSPSVQKAASRERS